MVGPALTLGGSSLLYLLIRRGATTITSLLYRAATTALIAWVRLSIITAITLLGTASALGEPGGAARQASRVSGAPGTGRPVVSSGCAGCVRAG
jgi:hypothetical protein